MSCNPCGNYNGSLCLFPKNGPCHDCLDKNSIEPWQAEMRKRCAEKPYNHRVTRCQECPQHTECIKENGVALMADLTPAQIKQNENVNRLNAFLQNPHGQPYVSIKPLGNDLYDVHMQLGPITFSFQTTGTISINETR